MKKQGILQAALAEAIAGMGHTDLLVIADAGLPAPPGVPCIDLAVRCGLPPMLDVASAVADELQVETLIVADELLDRETALPDALRQLHEGVDWVLDRQPMVLLAWVATLALTVCTGRYNCAR